MVWFQMVRGIKVWGEKTLDVKDPKFLEEMGKRLIEKIEDLRKGPSMRSDELEETLQMVLPFYVYDFKSNVVDPNRSVVLSRFVTIISKLFDIQKYKDTQDSKDEIDVNSPKFQQAFSWILDLIFVLISREVPVNARNIIFQDLADRLKGWEEKMNKVLSKSNSSSLVNLTNPLFDKELQEEFERIRGSSQSGLLDDEKMLRLLVLSARDFKDNPIVDKLRSKIDKKLEKDLRSSTTDNFIKFMERFTKGRNEQILYPYYKWILVTYANTEIREFE